MTINNYTAKWFSVGDWAWSEIEILAESEDQVQAYVDNECAPEHRHKPYKTDLEDSLTIKLNNTITLPYVMRTY